MSALLIAGAGGHGKVVADTARACGSWRHIAFVDDRHAELAQAADWPVLGALADAESLRAEFDAAVVAIGDSRVRLQWIDRLAAAGFRLPALVHPTAWVSPLAVLGSGTVVLAHAVVQAEARLGAGCIVNTAATVDHDCRIGDGVHICPGAHLAGEVHVGAESWIGIGASVIQRVCIGERVTVGAGAAVICDVEDDRTVGGCPARELAVDK